MLGLFGMLLQKPDSKKQIDNCSIDNLGNQSWKISEEIAKFFKIVEKKSKFIGVPGNKTKKNQDHGEKQEILASKLCKIKRYLINNSSRKLKKRLHLCVFSTKPQLSLTKNNEAKTNWHKMEAQIKHIGMKLMVQTSSVKMCYFFDLFRVYNWYDFALGKSLFQASSTECQKPRSDKNCILQTLLFLKLPPIPMKILQKLNFKNGTSNGEWIVREERVLLFTCSVSSLLWLLTETD